MPTILQHIVNRLIADPVGYLQTILYTIKYILNELKRTKRFNKRTQLFAYSLSQSRLNGLVLEFGVASGGTTNYLASLIPNEVVFGFDCFTGLPEKWGMFPKGYFKTEGLPPVRENVKLVPGLFQNTLGKFLQEYKEKARFIHIDADLYSSTIYVLKTLIEEKRIQEGTVIQFDELFNCLNWWKSGEYKALQELTNKYQIKYEILGYSLYKGCGSGQVAIKIKKLSC